MNKKEFMKKIREIRNPELEVSESSSYLLHTITQTFFTVVNGNKWSLDEKFPVCSVQFRSTDVTRDDYRKRVIKAQEKYSRWIDEEIKRRDEEA